MERNAKELLEKYKNGTCTEEECKLVEQYFNTTIKDNNELPKINKIRASFESRKIVSVLDHEQTIVLSSWKKYSVVIAACMLLVFGGLAYNYFWIDNKQKGVELVNDDVLPGSNRATLVLGDGGRIAVDDVPAGILVNESGVSIRKSVEGVISYEITESAADLPVSYNQIVTPNGGMYSISLPDGTRVRLNAGTSLRYPNRFAGNKRVVELKGEAYFEVKSNPEQPFIVKSKGQEVQVLGTKFNIQAYIDDAKVTTTLAEGKINLKNISSGIVKQLTPGQQGEVQGRDLQVEKADLNQAIAWIDNTFVFKGTSISEIMKELSRWYDIEIDLENIPEERFYATIPRTVLLSKVLSALEETSNLKFTVRGRRVIVQHR